MKKNNTSLVLVIDEDCLNLNSIEKDLKDHGYSATACKNRDNAINTFYKINFNAVLINVNPQKSPCLDLLEKIQSFDSDIPVIMMVDDSNLNLAVEAIKKGAFDIVPKPYGRNQLLNHVERAVEHHNFTRENKLLCNRNRKNHEERWEREN